jgi:TonB family protein
MADSGQFQLTFVDDRKPKRSALATSFVVQAIGVALLVQFGVIQPQHFVAAVKRYNVIELAATDTPTAHPRPPRRVVKMPPPPRPELDRLFEARVKLPPPPVRPTPMPEMKLPVTSAKTQIPVVQPPRIPQVGQFSSAAPAVVAVTKPSAAPRTGDFSSGSSATPTLQNVKARDVQTGGFGDPNGIRGVGDGKGKLVAAAVGSFDLPGGPGNGNGTGGARGLKGAIASAGFGNGVATSNPGRVVGGTAARGAIQQGGFGDSRAPVEQPKLVRASLTNTVPPTSPVAVLSKPQPVYTDEARSLKIEGEVLLEVLFTASGEARVSRVMRGLGHGLDEAATRAASHIRFLPAKRDGKPVDSTAVIHVVFQLAY